MPYLENAGRTLLTKNDICLCFCFLCQNKRNDMSNQVLFTEESMNLTVCEQAFESGQVFEELVQAKNMICPQRSNGWEHGMGSHSHLFPFPLQFTLHLVFFTLLPSSPWAILILGNLCVLVKDLLYWEIWALWALIRANIGLPFKELIFSIFRAHDTPKWQFSKLLQLKTQHVISGPKGSTNPKFSCSYNLYYCPVFVDITKVWCLVSEFCCIWYCIPLELC